MSGTAIKTGNTVLCGYCGIEATVESVKVYVGGLGFELACGHRNGYCEVCQKPVRDTTMTSQAIHSECAFCTTIISV